MVLQNKLELELSDTLLPIALVEEYNQHLIVLNKFNIKPLFRGKSYKEPQKVIVIHKSPEGNMQKFFEANGSWIATHGVKVSTIEVSDWV